MSHHRPAHSVKLATAFDARHGGFTGLPHPSPVPQLHPSPTVMVQSRAQSCGQRPTSGTVMEPFCGYGGGAPCPMEPHSNSLPQVQELQTGCPDCSSIYEADKIRTPLDRKMLHFYNKVVEPATDYNLTTLVFPY